MSNVDENVLTPFRDRSGLELNVCQCPDSKTYAIALMLISPDVVSL